MRRAMPSYRGLQSRPPLIVQSSTWLIAVGLRLVFILMPVSARLCPLRRYAFHRGGRFSQAMKPVKRTTIIPIASAVATITNVHDAATCGLRLGRRRGLRQDGSRHADELTDINRLLECRVKAGRARGGM
jgi:hypothetical protein